MANTRLIILVAVVWAGLGARGAITVTIQPSANEQDIVWTVSWDNLDDTIPGTFDWNSMDPATGAESQSVPWGTGLADVNWDNIGDPFGENYISGSNSGFGDGVDGVTATGPYGVGPDHDSALYDELFIFRTDDGAIPASGSFVLTVPGANLANYNLGTHTANPYATITVTATPIPEPETYAILFGLGVLGVAVWHRRKLKA